MRSRHGPTPRCRRSGILQRFKPIIGSSTPFAQEARDAILSQLFRGVNGHCNEAVNDSSTHFWQLEAKIWLLEEETKP
jgi:hypothetical protein